MATLAMSLKETECLNASSSSTVSATIGGKSFDVASSVFQAGANVVSMQVSAIFV